MSDNPLQRLRQLGQQVWLDDIRRGLFKSGELARLIADDGLAGLTSNPAIFAKAISDTDDYHTDIKAAPPTLTTEALYEQLAIADIQSAADAFASTYRQTNAETGYVSLEVSPHLALDTEGTIAAASRLWRAVDRPNVMIKIPGTREGLPAIRKTIASGINVNVTLIFSVARYREVLEAFLAGLADRKLTGESINKIASVASFFISRIDTLVDERLEQRIAAGHAGAASLRGTAGVASAGSAMQAYRDRIAKPDWQQLARAGARPQRLLWASTSTKNPAYSDVKYVEALIAADTVNTMPPETLAAYRDHGKPELRIDESVSTAPQVIAGLAQHDIDLEEVAAQLEAEGVRKFSDPYDRLLAVIDKVRR